jgi:hypothetical protein
MEKVYLLLRNNQQTGPFTIGELLQQQLRHSDMIWIEGKSNAWTYLSELELTPFVKKTENVQHPSSAKAEDEIEKKAEELRQRILSSAPKTYFPEHITEIESYGSSYKLEDEIEFVDVRKDRRMKKNTVLGEVILTCFVIALFMLGIYKGKSFLGVKQKVQNVVATELNTHDQHTAQKNKEVIQPRIEVIDTTKQADSLLALQKAKQKIATVKKPVADSIVVTIPQPVINTFTAPEEKAETSLPDEDSAIKGNVVAKKEVVSTVSKVKTNNEPVKEEKKGFLRGLFKKKNKDNSENAKNGED